MAKLDCENELRQRRELQQMKCVRLTIAGDFVNRRVFGQEKCLKEWMTFGKQSNYET